VEFLWQSVAFSGILSGPTHGRGSTLLLRGLHHGATLLLVVLVAGCAPGASSASTPALPAAAPASPASTPATSEAIGLTLPLAKVSAAPTFLPLPDPEGGPRARAKVTALPNGGAVVTGGLTANGATNQVLYYDPLSRSFLTLKNATLSNARYDHEATLLPSGNEILVTGGFNGDVQLASVELVTIDLADPTNSQTVQLSPLPEPRTSHAAVLVSLGTKGGKPWSGSVGVLIVGGCVPRPGRQAVPAASSLIYRLDVGDDGSLKGGRVVLSSSQPSVARYQHQAILLPGPSGVVGTDGDRVLVFGGVGADPDAIGTDGTTGPLSSAEVYEPSTDRWSPVHFEAAAPGARVGHRMARTPEGGALLVGGQSTATSGPRLVEEIDLDPRDATLGRLSQGASLSKTRVAPEIATLDDGRVLVVGGFDPATQIPRDDAEILSSTGQSAEPPFSIGSPRSEHGLASLGASVLVFGGRSTRDTFGSPASGLLLLKK